MSYNQAAKDQVLRRLCEMKPSGKLNVPLEVHQQWLRGGAKRQELFNLLKSVDYDKAGFLLCMWLHKVVV